MEAGFKVTDRDENEMTPLMHAALGGQFKCSVQLLNLGAQLDAKTSRGKAPIHYACEAGHSKLLKELIKWEVDVECTDL